MMWLKTILNYTIPPYIITILKFITFCLALIGWVLIIIFILTKLFPKWKLTQKLNNFIKNKILKTILYDLSDKEIQNLQEGVNNIILSIEEFINNNNILKNHIDKKDLEEWNVIKEIINKIIVNKNSIDVLQIIGFNFREALGEPLTIWIKKTILKNHDNDIDKIIEFCNLIQKFKEPQQKQLLNVLYKTINNQGNIKKINDSLKKLLNK